MATTHPELHRIRINNTITKYLEPSLRKKKTNVTALAGQLDELVKQEPPRKPGLCPWTQDDHMIPALTSDPSHLPVSQHYRILEFRLGRPKESLSLKQQLDRAEPSIPSEVRSMNLLLAPFELPSDFVFMEDDEYTIPETLPMAGLPGGKTYGPYDVSPPQQGRQNISEPEYRSYGPYNVCPPQQPRHYVSEQFYSHCKCASDAEDMRQMNPSREFHNATGHYSRYHPYMM